MKHLTLVVCLLALAFAASAQDLPQHFTGAGMGFQNAATPKASGWFDVCTQTFTNVYGCMATDYSGGTTSTRADIFPLIKTIKGISIFGRGGAGASVGANSGVGASFDAGGALAYAIPQKLFRTSGLYAVFSGSWQKRNVEEITSTGGLQAFGSQTIWRFGLGKGF